MGDEHKKSVDKRKNDRAERRKVIYGISLITQIGISIMVPIALCVAMGVVIQNKTNADFVVPIAILLGVITSFRNVHILTKKMYSKDMEKENKELQYFESLRTERESKVGK